jgi:hypothetical protein
VEYVTDITRVNVSITSDEAMSSYSYVSASSREAILPRTFHSGTMINWQTLAP